jgi:hypothetical protein
MNWDAIAAIGEAIGATAVVISLIYLATQIRQNTQTVRASTFQALSDSAQGRLLALQNVENARIWRIGTSEPESLNLDERMLYVLMLQANARGFENLYYQHQSGLLDTPQWSGYSETIKAMVNAPGFKYYWERRMGASARS